MKVRCISSLFWKKKIIPKRRKYLTIQLFIVKYQVNFLKEIDMVVIKKFCGILQFGKRFCFSALCCFVLSKFFSYFFTKIFVRFWNPSLQYDMGSWKNRSYLSHSLPLSLSLSLYLSIYLFTSIYLSIYLSISIDLSIYLFISICLNLSINIYLSWKQSSQLCEKSILTWS